MMGRRSFWPLRQMRIRGFDRSSTKASRGVAAARNSAARAARGEFLVDLDDDDVLLADGVERRAIAICSTTRSSGRSTRTR
ncbi:MAG: glycosyltransferase [Thermomicrobiales bacterium]